MTAYVTCNECETEVPWYYAFEFKHVPHGAGLHPYCARDRIDEEGCGPVFLALAIETLKEEKRLDE